MHILHHIMDGIRRYGPVYTTWMCRRALNRAHPEATILKHRFGVSWWIGICFSQKKVTENHET